ncbi:hypothetical protein LOTGIDRAFT_113440 [Lottia gigantea]|uniref:SSD domain-containing protein n=1 Tax=Lottia gigantea TaxID=225164 RepID=V4APZ9_LOTGI|nr:hypothetical protein LOTGIDRAFT_113440 [Lottia gigantea]ESO99297.1 hypothetical protein LOTGIDRAFT_113440 [Lottia gigantea]
MSDITTNLTELVYTTSTSLDIELTSNIQSDIGWFSLSFTFMITYVSFAASSNNMVANRGHLARAGVIGVLLAILAAFGTCAVGIDFVNIVGVMPFLVLGVGVDTMFVVMSEWAEHYDETSVEDQMGATLEKCGGSISIASLTDIIAFLIGVTSQFISIRNFCAYTAVALFFSFLWDLTFFMGCLAVHGQRVRARRCCMTCLVVPDRFRKWKSPERREEDESLCEKVPQLLLKISMSDAAVLTVKIVIILLFTGYVGASVWGIYNLQQGLVLNNLVNDQSYFRLFEDWNREYYKTVLPISLVFQDLDFSKDRDVNAMYEVFDTFQTDSHITNNSLICWYEEFKKSMLFNDTTHEVFVTNLKDFMFYAPSLSNDVTFTSDGSDILASRCHFITGDIPDSTDQGNLMLHVRELAAESDLNVFPYSAPFIYFEQYVMVLPSTLQTMGIAVACMFVITILFMPHPIMVTLVTLNMFSILAGILGFLYYWDLSLSSITMIHLIMSVGFSVDFSVHVCHGFISSESETRNQKARDAIRVAAAPILNGGITSLLGICMLVGSESYIFRSFFKIMVLVIIFGLAHSMLLLPVILSLVGPKLGQADEKTTDFIKSVPPTIQNGHSKMPSEDKNTYYLNHAYDN